ncbi:MAG: hypothetical protein JWM41_3931 [Gemmatimonadetes bacterium]|nr:hypothetical protein [Gemmatimonadota bacterium]
MIGGRSTGDWLTVSDAASEPVGAGVVYSWNGYAETESTRSLLRYVDTYSEQLRDKYLAWIHELGESRIDGRRLIDHLVLDGEFSYWWMTLFTEQSLWKQPSITDAIRLFALEQIIRVEKHDRVRLVTDDRRLHVVFRNFCRDLGLTYEWQRVRRRANARTARQRIYDALPFPAKAVVSVVRHVAARWPLRKSAMSGWFQGPRSWFLCSYFIHLDAESCAHGSYRSHLWEQLPTLLHEHRFTTNWLEHYLQSSVVPDPTVAMDWVRSFNLNRREQGFHTFVDSYLSWRIVRRVFRRWLLLNAKYWRLRNVSDVFRPKDSQFSLWPLMRKDWDASLRGPAAFNNLLWIELFDRAMSDLPYQANGLYLCENQAWERAFTNAWREHGHGRLTAVAHSTVRFWDLRYFTDPRTIRSAGAHVVPQPNRIALNGDAAVNAYVAAGYPREAIVECEALRYSYLTAFRRQPAKAVNSNAIKVLILGDFQQSTTASLLELLVKAASRVHVPADYTIKVHPNCMVDAQDYPSLSLQVVTDPLEKILAHFDVAYSSNVTSAAVDASLAGLPVVVVLDQNQLNLSPLRGRSGVRFVSTAGELSDALQVDATVVTNPDVRDDFFFLDPNLPRWKTILGIVPDSPTLGS